MTEISLQAPVDIPVRATFVGLRAVPWLAVAGNSLNPRLAVTASGLLYRVIRTRSLRFCDIEIVDMRRAVGTANLVFVIRDRPLTFVANLGTQTAARTALQRLPASIRLTPAARQVLETA